MALLPAVLSRYDFGTKGQLTGSGFTQALGEIYLATTIDILLT